MKPLDEKAYYLYMNVLQSKIDRIKKEITELPELERVKKLTYEEWKEWQSKGRNFSSIKFHER